MKTVHQYLNELDSNKIIESYLSLFPIEYESEEYEGLTVKEIREKTEADLKEQIERLKQIAPVLPENGNYGILFASRIIQAETYHLVRINELIQKGSKAETYAFDFNAQHEIMGYLVAETELTQHFIYDLIANVLNEAFFFGYEQEYLNDFLNELDKAIAEIKDGTAELVSAEELFEGVIFEGDETETEKDIHREIMNYECAYANLSKENELDKIIEFLNKNDFLRK